ncbi:MAG: hypothetical protein HKM07_02090 [Chlamydiae bacterium]|jgi:hypothetical protein|nr:hypothetical protein [Chlamydiota bacterium]
MISCRYPDHSVRYEERNSSPTSLSNKEENSSVKYHVTGESDLQLPLVQNFFQESFTNHQKYLITFKSLPGRVVCSLEMGLVTKNNVPIVVEKGFQVDSSTCKNPFHLTYYSKKNTLVIGSYGLRGGMPPPLGTLTEVQIQSIKDLLGQSDMQIAEIFRQRMPQGTYTCVNVVSLDYHFADTVGDKPSKVISLTVNNKEYISCIFYYFIMGFLIPDMDQFPPIEKDSLEKQLLQALCRAHGNIIEIEQAYSQCTRIDWAIANDVTLTEIILKKSNAVLAVYKTGKVLGSLIPAILRVVLEGVAMSRRMQQPQGNQGDGGMV